MKKRFSLILALLLVLALPVTVFATEDPITWSLSEDGKTMSDGQKIYERYTLADGDIAVPRQAYVWNQSFDDPEDEWTTYRVVTFPEQPDMVALYYGTYADGFVAVYTTKDAADSLEDFSAGVYSSMMLSDIYDYEAAELTLDWVNGLDGSDGARETLDVRDLGEVDRYLVWGGNAGGTFYHTHGAFYFLNETWYYINYDALDNSYFDADGNFSYRRGTVEALALGNAGQSILNKAIGEMSTWETEFEQDDSDLEIAEGVARVVFWILAVLLGFVVPAVPLILGLVFARSKKAVHPKRWYVLSALSLAWIALAALILWLLAA